MYRTTSSVFQRIPSFGFSGAGFLTAYHLGAVKCLLEHGYLKNFEGKANVNVDVPLLTGVSGGALVAAAVAAGIDPEVGMGTVLAVTERTRQEGFLDAFQPGFSLLDQVEGPFLQNIMAAVGGDTERLLRRTRGGSILRIGLTDRSIQPFIKNPKAYCFVNQYREAEDIVAACMLSSFVPGVTGPYSGSSPTMNRATARIREMAHLGFLKKQRRVGGEISTVSIGKPSDSKSAGKDGKFPRFVDGGLSNTFPVVDDQTVIVTPIRGRFEPNRWICPHPSDANDTEDAKLIELNRGVKVYLDKQNALTFRRMVLSSDENELQRRYSQGYDDAKRFLADNNSETVHKSVVNRI